MTARPSTWCHSPGPAPSLQPAQHRGSRVPNLADQSDDPAAEARRRPATQSRAVPQEQFENQSRARGTEPKHHHQLHRLWRQGIDERPRRDRETRTSGGSAKDAAQTVLLLKRRLREWACHVRVLSSQRYRRGRDGAGGTRLRSDQRARSGPSSGFWAMRRRCSRPSRLRHRLVVCDQCRATDERNELAPRHSIALAGACKHGRGTSRAERLSLPRDCCRFVALGFHLLHGEWSPPPERRSR